MPSRAEKTAQKAVKQAGKAGARALQILGETPELIQLRRNDRALRSEMDDHMHSIGRRAYTLHKRARGESPFNSFPTIMKEFEALSLVEEEYRSNRVKLNQVRERIRGKGRKG